MCYKIFLAILILILSALCCGGSVAGTQVPILEMNRLYIGGAFALCVALFATASFVLFKRP